MAKPSQIARSVGSHVIIYGEPKSGKSTLVMKLMEAGYKLWYISLDNDKETMYKMKLSPQELDERMEFFSIPDTRTFPVGIKTVREICKGKETFVCDAHGQDNCSTCKSKNGSFTRINLSEFGPKDILVIDHAGQLTESGISYIAKERSKNEEDSYTYKMTEPDWGTLGGLLSSIYTNIQQSNANIIVIAHTIESQLEDGSRRLLPQVGTGNFSRNAAKYFGHVIYLQLKNKSHKVGSSTTYDVSALSGSRGDIKIEDMKEPSLVPFFNGSIKPKEIKEHGSQVAQKILETSSVKIEQKQEQSAPPKIVDKALDEVLPAMKTPKEVKEQVKEEAQITKTMPVPRPALSIKERLAALNSKNKSGV